MGNGDTTSQAIPQHLVAVIDDNQGVRAALCNLLKSAGYRACTFASAEDFLDSALLAGIACAVADVDLPTMSGFGMLEQLQRKGPPLPVLLMTAHVSMTHRERALQLGAMALLVKPVHADVLLSHIRQAIISPSPPHA